VKKAATDGERAMLERLRSDEIAIERELAAARADSEALVAAAHSRAATLASKARLETDAEVTRLRAEEQRALVELVEAARAEADGDLEKTRRAAARRTEQALRLAIETVLGRSS
jgi:hypothetical protein